MGSAALAPPQLVDVTLALFAGAKSDITPSDCPEGISPDTQDGIYLPGGWFSRPGLHRLYAAGKLPAGTQVLYEKTYIQPNNDPLTLALTSDGQLWVEDVGNSPGNLASVFEVTPGLYAQSVTAYGREYIAFSDLLHGQSVPLQYDGINLDRVTQDGPGAAPSVANVAPATATIAGAGAGLGYAITSVTPSDPKTVTIPIFQNGRWTTETITYYSTLTVVAATNPLVVGELVTLSGINPATFDTGPVNVSAVVSTTTFKISFYSSTSAGGTGGTATAEAPSLVRVNGIATATTSAAHGFQVGWQVQIAIPNSTIGGGIASVTRDGAGNCTVTTSSAHGLSPGDYVCITGVTDSTFDVTTTQVTSVTSATVFVYLLQGSGASSSSGNVQDIWNTTAFIQSVPSATSFTYQNPGPNDFSNQNGSATIVGQISPGNHGFVLIFLTRNGALTAPSPPVQFQANGGQQALFTNILTGPSNVVARLLAATGAGGNNYFTIPAVPQLGGVVVGTSFVIPDNTSTSALIDFNDNTLFDGIAIDQIGNDLFDQRVLGPVLGFFSFASRLMCWGDYQKIENMLNMGFCGGPSGAAPGGWTLVSVDGSGTVVPGGSWPSGQSWKIVGDGSNNAKGIISQSVYLDASGTAIALPLTQYSFRCWARASAPGMAGVINVSLSSASTGFSSTVSIPASSLTALGGFTSLREFSLETPAVIPSDMIFEISATGIPAALYVLLGELQLIYTQNPYDNVLVHASYVLNPEGFAQTTGNLGAADDDSAVQCLALLRKPALLETLEGVHIFQDNGGEPDTWEVDSLTRAVGAAGLRAGDPGKFGTGDAAEDWAVIASQNGAYLFAGGEFWKVSQEISRGSLPQSQDPRPTWDDINWAAKQTIVAKNDPAKRRAYFALPLNGATAPNYIAVLDYREMDTATQIASAAPVHITIQGKMKSSDLTRKWSWWNIAANDLEILERPGNARELFIAGGARNGAAYGNIYSLDPAKLTDDDYGQISPYYTTYAFTDHDQEQALGLGADLHLYKHIHAFVTGMGMVTITPIRNSLYNFQPALSPRLLTQDINAGNFQGNDLEWSGMTIRGQRVFFRISVQPLPGATDVQIRLQKFVVGMMKDPVLQFRQSGV